MLLYAFGSGAAIAGSPCYADVRIDRIVNVILKNRICLLVFFQRQSLQSFVVFNAVCNQLSYDLVSAAEGQAFFDHVIGAIGCVDKALGNGIT